MLKKYSSTVLWGANQIGSNVSLKITSDKARLKDRDINYLCSWLLTSFMTIII